MDLRTPPGTRLAALRIAPAPARTLVLLGFLVAIVGTGSPGDTAGIDGADRRFDREHLASAANPTDGVHQPSDGADEGDPGQLARQPDRVADHPGGIAARLHAGSAGPIAGDVFLLMALSGSTANARLYDRTPYTHDNGFHDETFESNLAAARSVRAITGSDVEILELTSASGGGRSGGLTYAIAYLNVVSNGAFTGDLRVAATGGIGREGHIAPIKHIDAKTAAAHLADADVLFTPNAPSSVSLDAYSARFVGEAARDGDTAVKLNDPRRLDVFHRWGSNRPDGMDVVDVRHLVDVASYLCGTGSGYACHIRELLDDEARRAIDDLQEGDRSEFNRLRPAAR